MAVAVKTSPGARSSGSLANPAILSLTGVLYVLGCLGIVFALIPGLWWSVWRGLGWGSAPFVGGSLLLLLCLAAAVGLLWLGGRLLGPNPPVGVRSGVFVGCVGLLVVVGLTRWASLWFEHYAYTTRSLEPRTGAILTALAGALFLAGWLWLFTRPWTQNFVVGLEQGGWFHATSYKSNQGLKVRRGTMVGLLLLIGTGVYTLVSHGTLRRGAPDWVVDVPFTPRVVVDSIGDAESQLIGLPAADKAQVQVRWPGNVAITGLQTKNFLSPDEFQARVNAILDQPESKVPAEVKKKLAEAAKGDVVEYLLLVNREITAGLERLVKLRAGNMPLLRDDIRTRLLEMDNRTGWTDVSELIAAVEKEVDSAVATLKRDIRVTERALKEKKAEPVAAKEKADRAAEEARDEERVREREKLLDEQAGLRWVFGLPTAVVVVDRYALLGVNDRLKPTERVRVGVNRNPSFKLKEGEVVSTARFGEAEVDLYMGMARRVVRSGSESKKVLDNLREAEDGAEFKNRLNEWIGETNPPLRTQLEALRAGIRETTLPERQTLAPAVGTTRYASIPLLPSVQFTVPLLVLAVALWLAWRVVNMPSFADFLIATEAELNKVSWTTQRRLAQDTVVVLVTVFLMALFLFSTDYFWKTVLSWKPIGVLHIPEDSGKQKQKLEEKRW